jgi:formate hydrogenlyase transcriptional activator
LIDRYAQKLGKKIRNVDKKTMELFHAYYWPGNIRESQNVVERAVSLSEGETFIVDEAWLLTLPSTNEKCSKPHSANAKAWWGPTGAAAMLGIPRQTLESKIRKLGIHRHRFKAA